MEQKRTTVIITCVAACLLYYFVLLPRILPKRIKPAGDDKTIVREAEVQTPATQPAQEAASRPVTEAAVVSAGPTPVTTPAPEAPVVRLSEVPQAAILPLSNDFIKVEFSQEGGGIRAVTAVKDFEAPFSEEPLQLVNVDPTKWPEAEPIGAITKLSKNLNFDHARYRVVQADGEKRVFELTAGGCRITKTFRFTEPNRYGLAMEVKIENAGAEALDLDEPVLQGPVGLNWETRERDDGRGQYMKAQFQGLNGNGAYRRKVMPFMSVNPQKPDKSRWSADRPKWMGISNLYFLSALKPVEGFDFRRVQAERLGGAERDSACLSLKVEANPLKLEPGASRAWDWRMYFGPSEEGYFRQEGDEDLTSTIDYGKFLGWIKKPLTKLFVFILNLFARIWPHNYGLAIIVLTILVRALMHPLSVKQFLQSQKMQLIQPEIKKLQEKYKEDRQKLGQEQMKLMQRHGVSYFGCLGPMIIQLPIFITLFYILQRSIDIRKEPFFWWITDLSKPDFIMPLPFQVFNINSFRILPILSMLGMILMKPPAPKPDPNDEHAMQQAKSQKMTMYFMGLFFGLMLYNYASGLMLYWIASSMFGFLENMWIRKSHQLDKLGLAQPKTAK